MEVQNVLCRSHRTRKLHIRHFGLPGNLYTLAEIHRWAKIHVTSLEQFLRLRHRKGKAIVPCDTTLARILEKLSLDDLQKAFWEVENCLYLQKDQYY